MTDDKKARHVGRREALRSGIPDSIPLPKFLTTDEIHDIKRYKRANSASTWEESVAAVIKTSEATLTLE